MERWTQAIYEATGIPLSEEEVAVVPREGEWWLLVFRQPVLALGGSPDATHAVTPALRSALAGALQARLSRVLPRVLQRVEAVDPVGACDVTAVVVNGEDPHQLLADAQGSERGWPNFGLRLSVGVLDVEVDLNPYQPEDPVDLQCVDPQRVGPPDMYHSRSEICGPRTL